MALAIYTEDSITLVTSDDVASTDRWLHIAGVYDGTQVVMYVNGILQADTQEATGSVLSFEDASNTILIGNISMEEANVTAHWDGRIDDVRIYSRGLSAEEVVEVMQGRTDGTLSDGLVARWDFSEGDGLTVSDLSGNGHDGALQGGGWSATCPTEDLDGDDDPAWSDCDEGDSSRSTSDLDGDGLSSCDGDCLDYDPIATDYSLVTESVSVNNAFHSSITRYMDSKGTVYFTNVYGNYWHGYTEDSSTESIYSAAGLLIEERFENDSDLSGTIDVLSHSIYSHGDDGFPIQKETAFDSDADGVTDYTELVTYEYGADGLLETESLVRTDPDGGLLYGLDTTYTYTDGLLTASFYSQDTGGGGSPDTEWTDSYVYDSDGRLTSQIGTASDYTVSHYAFVYNSNGDLSSKSVDFSSSSNSYTDSYSYSHTASTESCD
jgi:hypothetical protein